MPQSTSTLMLFQNQTFRMLWIAVLASNFGGLVQAVGAAGNGQDHAACAPVVLCTRWRVVCAMPLWGTCVSVVRVFGTNGGLN